MGRGDPSDDRCGGLHIDGRRRRCGRSCFESGFRQGDGRRLGPEGIRVNCIAPGYVYTPMVYARGMEPELREARRKNTLLQTEGTGWDVGNGVVYLASDQSAWVSGIILSIDAGSMAGTVGNTTPTRAFE